MNRAPDKIYVLPEWASVVKVLDEEVEYIRKDALLEWAREKKEKLGKMFDAMPATAIGAKLDACKEFIDKINSL